MRRTYIGKVMDVFARCTRVIIRSILVSMKRLVIVMWWKISIHSLFDKLLLKKKIKEK